jgi:hypothetical protein
MIKNLLLSLIYDVLKILTQNKDFFEKSENQRKEICAGIHDVPKKVCEYLSEVSAETFFKDLDVCVEYVNSTEGQEPTLKNKLTSALGEFIAYEMPEIIEAGEHANAKIEYKGTFGAVLKDLIKNNSYQEITGAMESFMDSIKHIPAILIQSPYEIDSKLKTEIRQELQKNHPHSIPIFAVNKKILGGFRIFVNGAIKDYSWLSKINRITSIK